jgi:hypothetical protein
MSGPVETKITNSKGFVIGKKGFAAISAVEGLKLHSESAERLQRTCCLPPAERRAETIRAFVQSRKRG